MASVYTILTSTTLESNMSHNFLALARQRPPERHPVRVNQVAREAVELLAYPLRVDSVEVVWDLAEELPVRSFASD